MKLRKYFFFFNPPGGAKHFCRRRHLSRRCHRRCRRCRRHRRRCRRCRRRRLGSLSPSDIPEKISTDC